MQQTSESPPSAILVSIDLGGADYRESLEELRLLAENAPGRGVAGGAFGGLDPASLGRRVMRGPVY